MRRQIDYRLARRAVLRDWHRGRLRKSDLCDAHPDLVRAARNVGVETAVDCPICEKAKLRNVSYVYGDSLKTANGRCISSPGELEKLGAAFPEFACYVVEVCTDCLWNHLIRSYLTGRAEAEGPKGSSASR